MLWWLLGDICGADTVKEIGFQGGDSRPAQQPSNKSKGRIKSRALHLSHGKAVSAMYPDEDHATSASVRGKTWSPSAEP